MITENKRLENEYILKAYLFQILLITWGLSYILIDLVNRWLTYRANVNNPYLFTRMVELIGPVQLIFVVIAAVLGFILLSVYHKIKVMMLKSKISGRLGFSKRLNRQVSWSTSFRYPLIIINIIFYILKWCAKIFLFFSGILFSAFAGSASTSNNNYNRPSSSQAVNQFNRQKDSAKRDSRQKQKEADYALKHAKKQALYNPNTVHMKNRINRANAIQHEADKAAKKARKL